MQRARWSSTPPSCCGRWAPAHGLRSRCTVNSIASRAADDNVGRASSPAIAADLLSRRGCVPAAASREAPVLEAVGAFPDWRANGQTLPSEHDESAAHGNGSAESDSHPLASPPEQHSAAEEAPRGVIASSPTTADAGGSGVARRFDGLGEVPHTEDAAGLGRAADAVTLIMAESSTATDEGAAEASAADGEVFQGLGELVDIEELRGVRVSVDGNGKAIVEYRVHWKVRSLLA